MGGYLADRLGGVRLRSVLLIGIGAVYAIGTTLPALAAMEGLLPVGMACLSMGNGAVFHLVP
ncbi:MAG: hypothetical protein EXR47_06690 [Dehalococcoidia bacterium]|nr:hypothetical protein [Dehalococcoidia bacterium]